MTAEKSVLDQVMEKKAEADERYVFVKSRRVEAAGERWLSRQVRKTHQKWLFHYD